MKKSKWITLAFVLAGAAALVGADQWTKALVVQANSQNTLPVTVIPGLLEFCYVENEAAAMGLFAGLIWLVIACTALVSIIIIAALFLYKDHTAFSLLSGMLLLAGGIGNLCDRFQHGYVVDFIHVLFFPYVFNVADCCVTIGVVCFAVHYILQARREKAAENAAGEE